MDEVERTDPDPPPTLVGTHSGSVRVAAALPTRGTEIGRYLVTGEIGRGAMGAVLAAYDADLDRKVAIKLIGEKLDADDERRHRLLGEAKSMARITHPNVVTVYDAGVWHDRLWVAMELVDGVTLDRWRDAAPRSLAEIVETMVAAARGLAAAHDAGVLHGDFKPSNVLVARNGRVVVADFGLANRLDDAPAPSESALDAPIGTPAYMSPEHFLAGAIDARADQFAFCVTLFEQLTGERPFKGRSLLELASAISGGTVAVAAAAKIPMRVRAVVMRGLASQPSDRFASMHELIAALQSAVRPRWQWWLGLGGAAAIVGGVAWLLVAQPDPLDMCPPAHARVQQQWNAERRAAVAVSGDGMTADALARRTDHLRNGIDTYFGEWSELFDEACHEGAMRSNDVAQQARVACIENRFEAGRGFVQLVTSETIQSNRVDGLIEALPDLAQCRGPSFGRWEPVPTDPELGREVARLRIRLDEAALRRRAGHLDAVAPEVAAVLAAARASGLSHVVGEALLEQAAVIRAQGDAAGADAAVDEALTVALRDGHDHLAARAVNRRLLLMQEDPELRVLEAVQWAHLGEALAARAGARGGGIGDFPNNLSIILRHHADSEGSLVQCRRAEELYREELGDDARPTIGARANCAAALMELSRFEEAETLLRDAAERYDALLGREHADAITMAWNRAQLEVMRGDRRLALALGRDAMERQLAATGKLGRNARKGFLQLAHLNAAIGEIAAARTEMANAHEAHPMDEAADIEWMFTEAAVTAHAREYERSIAIATRILESPRTSAKLRDRARFHRAHIELLIGRDQAALDDASPLCADRVVKPGGVPAFFCYAIGSLAAKELGDDVRAAVWLAWSESVFDLDPEDQLMRRVLRAVVGGSSDAASKALLRAERDVVVQRGHPDHPLACVVDRWLTPSDTKTPDDAG